MANSPLEPQLSAELNRQYLPFFHSVRFIGGDDACNKYVDGTSSQGSTMYKCMADAARQGLAEGPGAPRAFLMIPDDAIFRPWMLKKYPVDSIWSVKNTLEEPPTQMGQPIVADGHWGAAAGCPVGFVREPVPLELWPAEIPQEDRRPMDPAAVGWGELNAPKDPRLTYLSLAIHGSPRLQELLNLATDAPRPFNCIPSGGMADFTHIHADHVGLFGEIADLLHGGGADQRPVFNEVTTGMYLHIINNVMRKTRGAGVGVAAVPTQFVWGGNAVERSVATAQRALDLQAFPDTVLFHAVKYHEAGGDPGLAELLRRFNDEQWVPAVQALTPP